MPMSTPTRVRLADFLLNPEIDESRLELIDGEVVAKPMPTWGHARVANRIGSLLEAFGSAGVEPRAVIQSANASLIPDVAFYRTGEPDESEYMHSPPHLAVEVMSPGQGIPFMRRKAALYARFGVECTWVVDLNRREVHVFELGTERTLGLGQRLTTPAVPGLDIDVSALFPAPG